ncbi:MAG: hypothetical protein AAF587_34815 [Bacteroidota bacterium]
MRHQVIVVGMILMLHLFFCGSLSAQTPSCSSSVKAVSDMWDSFGEWKESSYPVYVRQAATAVKVWHTISKPSYLTIGPRILKISRNQKGIITDKGTHTFISPPIYTQSVNITIKKLAGSGQTGFSICQSASDGSSHMLYAYNFIRGEYYKTKSFRIRHAKGTVLSISIRNYSPKESFKYNISAT